ncbi:hypothetical protein [uncultured Victivallis sp.]|uniref:hypothetical protein n=1 Tax=uncultured Victivallis sp. TaxID=354118 RepID=UPI0025D1836E|nr:hypothetical protein [uncultured Victivallis sp.]
MFRNSDPPISLFSFQDIVTTLIGIMVLFVLLLSLELIEATRIFEESSPVREELARLREQRKSLETQVEEQARRLKELAAELDSVSDMSEAELLYSRQRVEHRIDSATKACSSAEELLLRMRERKAEVEAAERELAGRREKLQQRTAQLEQVRRNGDALQRRNEEQREELRRLANAVSIEFEGDMSKQPVMVECSETGFRVKRLDSPEIREIPFQGITVTAEIEKLLAVLREYPASSCYILFLIKPSAAKYAEYLLNQYSLGMSSYEMGMDPLYEREHCF